MFSPMIPAEVSANVARAKPMEAAVRIGPFACKVGEGLRHRFAEPILERPRVEAEQS